MAAKDLSASQTTPDENVPSSARQEQHQGFGHATEIPKHTDTSDDIDKTESESAESNMEDPENEDLMIMVNGDVTDGYLKDIFSKSAVKREKRRKFKKATPDAADAKNDISNQKQQEKKEKTNVDVDDFTYRMDFPYRGLALIINNGNFGHNMPSRSGTNEDRKALAKLFKEMGFEVLIFNDQGAGSMLEIMGHVAAEDHSACACFVAAIMSHGEEGGIYGADGYLIDANTLMEPFKGSKCRSLIGKPKLFFIQACQGAKFDPGVELDSADSRETRVHKLPVEADILIAYSTVPGYYSWRNAALGSWFVRAITSVFTQHWQQQEIMWLLTRVNYEVATQFESKTFHKDLRDKQKQIPHIVTRLTKQLYFK